MSRGWFLTAIVLAVVSLAYAGMAAWFDSPSEGVQITWTCVGIAGGIITGANLVDSWIDLKALGRSGRNGELKVVALRGIRRDALRQAQMVIVVGIGLWSLAHGPTLTAEQREKLDIPTWTATSIILTTGFALIVVIAVVQAILDRRERLQLYDVHGTRRPDHRDT